MNELDRLERAERANRLLNDPLLKEGFDLVRTAIHHKWESTPIRDRDGAHELRLMLKLLTDVEGCLKQAVNDGKIVQFEIDQRSAAKKVLDLIRR